MNSKDTTSVDKSASLKPLPNHVVGVEDFSLQDTQELKLTKQEWIIIFNIMTASPLNGPVSVGTIRAFMKPGVKLDNSLKMTIDIISKIEPFVAALSNKDVTVRENVRVD